MTKRIITLLVFAFVSTVHVQAQVKIGFADIERIFSNMPEVQQAGEELSALIDAKRDELSQLETQLQTDLQAYQEIASSLSREEQAARENELTERDEALTDLSTSYQEEIQQKQIELFNPLEVKANDAIKMVADEMGLDLVLSRGSRESGDFIFYSGNNSIDITDNVIQKLTN